MSAVVLPRWGRTDSRPGAQVLTCRGCPGPGFLWLRAHTSRTSPRCQDSLPSDGHIAEATCHRWHRHLLDRGKQAFPTDPSWGPAETWATDRSHLMSGFLRSREADSRSVCRLAGGGDPPVPLQCVQGTTGLPGSCWSVRHGDLYHVAPGHVDSCLPESTSFSVDPPAFQQLWPRPGHLPLNKGARGPCPCM